MRHRAHPVGLALALLAALGAVPARALDWSLQAQPGYTASSGKTTDETGNETRTESSAWNQRYRLNLDAPIFPRLVLNAGGLLDWSQGTNRSGGVDQDFDSKRWTGFSHLRLGGDVFSGGLDFERRDEQSESRAGGVTTRNPRLVIENYGASLGWRPADLPSLELQLHRQNGYYWGRVLADRTADDALVATRYSPVRPVDLGLSFRASKGNDRITGVRTRDLNETLRATYSDTYLAGRASFYAGYTGTMRQSSTSVSGAGGTVATVQVPTAGLSIVETFPAVPTQVTLNPNAALVNGDLAASAGLNLGYSGGSGGQRPYRDMGAQFPDAITPVNAVYVWVDRQLPADLVAAFEWTAYQSDDNLNWTSVAITGPVQFGLLQNRFEIPIERTEARYLKVVTRPIPTTLTVDPQYAEIFVTEAQFLLVVPAEQVRGRSSSVGGSFSATGRLSLVPSIGLAYDGTTSLTHSDSAHVTWAISNGLSAARRLTPVYGLSGRVERTDSDAGRGHSSANRWGAALSVEPLPTLSGSVTYSGQLTESSSGGTAFSQGVGAFARADLYEGISASASVTHARGTNEADQDTQGTTASLGATLVPNRVLTLGGTASYTESSQTGGDAPETSDRRIALDGTATLNPFPSLSLTGGATRFIAKDRPSQTLLSFAGSFSPFPGGDLQLRYAYQETLDTAADVRTRFHGPGLRWNIRPGWYLDSAYTFQWSRSPAERASTQIFSANLTITLR